MILNILLFVNIKFDEFDFKTKNSLNKKYILMKNMAKKYLLNYVIFLDIN